MEHHRNVCWGGGALHGARGGQQVLLVEVLAVDEGAQPIHDKQKYLHDQCQHNGHDRRDPGRSGIAPVQHVVDVRFPFTVNVYRYRKRGWMNTDRNSPILYSRIYSAAEIVDQREEQVDDSEEHRLQHVKQPYGMGHDHHVQEHEHGVQGMGHDVDGVRLKDGRVEEKAPIHNGNANGDDQRHGM